MTQADILALFTYENGILIWRHRANLRLQWNAAHAGKVAGHTCKNGYVTIGINGRFHLAHRIVWIFHNGEWPKGHIDHINGDKHDNRIENLRDVTRSENAKNLRISKRNSSGATNVHWDDRRGKWRVRIMANGVRKHCGEFLDKDDAIIAAQKARTAFGYHPNHGKSKQELAA